MQYLTDYTQSSQIFECLIGNAIIIIRFRLFCMLTMASLRLKTKIDYKALNEGESVPSRKRASFVKPSVLPDTYEVERLIEKKEAQIR